MKKWPYLIVWSCVYISIACHRVTESSESEEQSGNQNTTTLYPVTNDSKTSININKHNKQTSENLDVTTWRIETSYGESKLPETFADNDTESKENKEIESEKVNCSKEFKPSPQLGVFPDESSEVIPTRTSLNAFVPLRKPASGFLSSARDPFKTSFSPQKEIYRDNDFPYKIEDTIFTKARNNWLPAKLESKPTVEAPVRVPAGGLYKSPIAFKDKPGLSGADDDFGLDFSADVKEHSGNVKKRVDPWKNLLHLVTALIPVGLIISALTPSVITIEDVGGGHDNRYPPPIYRRSDTTELAPISESCRRRLLCELHSERNYKQGQTTARRKGKHCYKLRCEDPEALSKTLQWLLTYHRNGPDDQRGRHNT